MHNRCLACYGFLDPDEKDYHMKCSRHFFSQDTAPLWSFDQQAFRDFASEHVERKWAIPGVQPKLSIHWSKQNRANPRITLVGMLGNYILKLPTEAYPSLPEVEDLTMHLASLARIDVVPHTLIRLNSGDLAYLTKRIDREGKNKLAMEDMCQLSGRLTEDKYKGSVEQIAKTILRYSANPMLDIYNFSEQVVFAYLTGNADMHLKNYSLIEYPDRGYVLSPAYDLVATILVNPKDSEELALPLNGKKKRIKRTDFIHLFETFGLSTKQQENIFKKFVAVQAAWSTCIADSFLSEEMKVSFQELIDARVRILFP
jgi:serine/threonine-protein kinase HipA